MSKQELNANNYAQRVTDQATAFLDGTDATHGNFQSVLGVPTFAFNGIAYTLLGSTGTLLTTKGDILTYSTVPTRLGIGANDTVLVADSAQATGNKWSATLAGLTLTSPTVNSPTISGGTINNAVIGGVTPAAATVTALATTSTISTAPSSDSTSLWKAANNANTSNVFVVDSTNQRIGINANVALADTPQKKLHLFYGDMRFEQITAPGACTAALAGAGAGNIDNGAHIYKVTFVTSNGETDLGTASSTVTVTDKTTNGQISLTAIPTGTAGLQVTSRKIYRTKAGGSSYFLLTTLADNTTTTYTDNTADASLDADDATFRNNTTSGGFWIGSARGGFLGSSAGANVSFGVNTLGNATTANNNSAFGVNALNLVTTATFNTAIGSGSFSTLVSGSHNVGVGYASALVATGSNTTAVGSQALRSLSTGASNTALGAGAGYLANGSSSNATTTGTLNTFLGRQTGYANSTQWSRVIAIGNNAVAGANNICVIGGTGSDAVDLALERTTASARLHVTKVDTGTNTVLNVEIINHNSSGSIAANFGVGSLWTGQDTTTADVEFGRLRYYWSTATHASRKANGVLSAYDTAERDCIFWGASGSAPMISFLSVTTPIVQITTGVAAATFTANTSGIVNDTATWDSYTIGQVVKALRNYGLLA